MGSLGEKVELLVGPAMDFISQIEDAEVVICDPPRKGMEAALIKALAHSSVETLILVYCGFDAFLRDCEALLLPGRLRLTHLAPVALFPHTKHLEVVAIMRNSQV